MADLHIRIYIPPTADWWGQEVPDAVAYDACDMLVLDLDKWCRQQWPGADIRIYTVLHKPVSYNVDAYYEGSELNTTQEYAEDIITAIEERVQDAKYGYLAKAQYQFTSYRFRCWSAGASGVLFHEHYDNDASAIARAIELSRGRCDTPGHLVHGFPWRDVEVTRKGELIVWLKDHGQKQHYPPQED